MALARTDTELAEAWPQPSLLDRVSLHLLDAGSGRLPLPLDGSAHGFRVHTRCRLVDERSWQLEIMLTAMGGRPEGAGIQVRLGLESEGALRFMIPGCLYPLPAEARASSPVYSEYPDPDHPLESDHWSFDVDRASHPVVFGWTQDACWALLVDESSSLGPTGIGFAGSAGERYLLANFPGREEPVVYGGDKQVHPALTPVHSWFAGETVVLRLRAMVGAPDLHAYDAILRDLYSGRQSAHPFNRWLDPQRAAALAAEGLFRWHYRPEHRILAETAVFERGLDGRNPVAGDRLAMHVAWLSGVPTAAALLEQGRRERRDDYITAATGVLDHIASALAPCGAFWGQWTLESGWTTGWSRGKRALHARTAAEATLFLLRALASEEARGVEHPLWRQAARSNLRYAIGAQRADGAFPASFDCQTGAALTWDGCAGMLWIAALVEGRSEVAIHAALRAAERAGAYYRRFVLDELLYGAPEDVELGPTSEDGYNAVIAYVSLHEATADPEWLELARRAGDWTMTFRLGHNLELPEHTLMRTYDFRSRGADIASTANQHLHSYGLICLPEMLRLSRLSGDDYYRQRTRDNLHCFLQFVAREDGDFNARKGMVTERYYHTRCFGPKGGILPLAHAWSAGLLLYACQAARDYGRELEL